MTQKNTIVSISYIMRNRHGEVLETRSTSYHHGSTTISPILQRQLEDLEPGQTRRVYLKKGQEDADDDFTFDVTINTIREASPLKIHLLTGFLGSGKTTAIHQACRLLAKQNIPVAVITNDQGSRLVDGDLFTHLGIPSGQVTNGCFCCKYNDLDAAIRYLIDPAGGVEKPGIIFAESVGSCTDLVATVLKPLLQQHPEWQTTITTFADVHTPVDFDESINYIYNKQLEEAKIIVVSKIDLLEDTTRLKAQMQNRYPEKTILYQNSFNEEHIARWLQTLDTATFKNLEALDIDYDTYGAGEAKLAWLDQQLEITSPDNTAQHAAIALIKKLTHTTHPIGHLKFLLDGKTKISITATGSSEDILSDRWHPSDSGACPTCAATATLLINARIQTEPETLSSEISTAIAQTETEHTCTIRTITETCFQPGYPRPTHRMR